MSRVTYTVEQLKKLGKVQVNGGAYEDISKLVDKHPVKIDNLLEKKNAKVKNATKVEVDGLKFDSKLEYFMYTLLKGEGIEFEFQKVYLLQERFRYGTEAVRVITLTVDFWLPKKNVIIDTKGHQTQQGAIKWKMLKLTLRQLWLSNEIGSLPKIEMPKNKKECELLFNRLLFDKT